MTKSLSYGLAPRADLSPWRFVKSGNTITLLRMLSRYRKACRRFSVHEEYGALHDVDGKTSKNRYYYGLITFLTHDMMYTTVAWVLVAGRIYYAEKTCEVDD